MSISGPGMGTISHKRLKYFSRDMFTVKMFTLASVTVTFGVAYPPLAAMGLMAILALSYSTQVAIARVWYDAVQSRNTAVMDDLRRDCSGLFPLVRRSVLVLFPSIFLFQALFVYDTIGSAETNSSGLRDFYPLSLQLAVALVCVPGFAMVMYGAVWLCQRVWKFDKNSAWYLLATQFISCKRREKHQQQQQQTNSNSNTHTEDKRLQERSHSTTSAIHSNLDMF